MRRYFLAFAMMALASAAAAEENAETYIPFANTGGIQDWRALDDKGLYVRGQSRQWYYATLASSCFGLSFVETLAFLPAPNGSFDKFSSVLVQGQRCRVVSLVKSGPPPGADRKKDKP